MDRRNSRYIRDQDDAYQQDTRRFGYGASPGWNRGRDAPDDRYGQGEDRDIYGQGAGYWEGEHFPERSRDWSLARSEPPGYWGDPFYGFPPTAYYPRPQAGRHYRQRQRDDRDFFDRASDEVSSWFGDEDAERRRERDHRGRGPKAYQRSDGRIEEDVNDRLTDDSRVDASEITVSVKDREVTLDGTVDSRAAKRAAEDCADSVSGIEHVQNNLRVQRNSSDGRPGTQGTTGL